VKMERTQVGSSGQSGQVGLLSVMSIQKTDHPSDAFVIVHSSILSLDMTRAHPVLAAILQVFNKSASSL